MIDLRKPLATRNGLFKATIVQPRANGGFVARIDGYLGGNPLMAYNADGTLAVSFSGPHEMDLVNQDG